MGMWNRRRRRGLPTYLVLKHEADRPLQDRCLDLDILRGRARGSIVRRVIESGKALRPDLQMIRRGMKVVMSREG